MHNVLSNFNLVFEENNNLFCKISFIELHNCSMVVNSTKQYN